MYTQQHALTRAWYSREDNGLVRVERGSAWGLFDGDGVWQQGEVDSADPERCRWISSRADAAAGDPQLHSRDRAVAFAEFAQRLVGSSQEQQP